MTTRWNDSEPDHKETTCTVWELWLVEPRSSKNTRQCRLRAKKRQTFRKSSNFVNKAFMPMWNKYSTIVGHNLHCSDRLCRQIFSATNYWVESNKEKHESFGRCTFCVKIPEKPAFLQCDICSNFVSYSKAVCLNFYYVFKKFSKLFVGSFFEFLQYVQNKVCSNFLDVLFIRFVKYPMAFVQTRVYKTSYRPNAVSSKPSLSHFFVFFDPIQRIDLLCQKSGIVLKGDVCDWATSTSLRSC